VATLSFFRSEHEHCVTTKTWHFRKLPTPPTHVKEGQANFSPLSKVERRRDIWESKWATHSGIQSHRGPFPQLVHPGFFF
jgi:hypothetical protein